MNTDAQQNFTQFGFPPADNRLKLARELIGYPAEAIGADLWQAAHDVLLEHLKARRNSQT